MSWGAVAAGVIGVAGGMMGQSAQAKAAKEAAAAAAPYGVSGPFGSVNYGPNHTASYDLGATGNQFSGLAQQLGLGALGNVTGNPMDALTPDMRAGYGNASGILQQTGGQQNANANSLFASLQQFGNDPTAIGNHMYQLLSAQAQPGQDQAYNGLQSKLFAQGRLGTTGGGNEFKGFFDSANQADIGRQIAGAQFGQQYQSQLQDQFRTATGDSQNTAVQRYNLAGDVLQKGMGINAAYTSQAANSQNLYSSMFQPLFQSQGLGAGGNPQGAAYGMAAAQGASNAQQQMFGGLGDIAKGVIDHYNTPSTDQTTHGR